MLSERTISQDLPVARGRYRSFDLPVAELAEKAPSSCCATVLGCICSFFIGLSVFVATESIFVQDLLFTFCFSEGKQFAGYSSLFIFLPGLAVNLLNPLFAKCRSNTGVRKSTFFCVLFGTLMIWGAVVYFFFSEMMHGPDSSRMIAYGMEAIVGFFVCFCYASYTPLLSILQQNFYVAFSLGLYAPSTLVMLPAMLFSGEVCSCTINTTKVPPNNFTDFQCQNCHYSVEWTNLLLFYIPIVVVQVLGIASFFILSGLPEASFALSKVNSKSCTSKSREPETPEISSAFDGLEPLVEETPSSPVQSDQCVRIERDQFEHPRDHNDSGGSLHMIDVVGGDVDGENLDASRKHTLCSAFGRIKMQCVTIIINTFASQTLVALNTFITSSEIDDLATVLMYLYYGCTALGVMLCFIPAIRKLPPLSLLLVSFLRLAYVVVIYMLVATDQCGCALWAVVSIHIVAYTLGGIVFSSSFPSGVNAFKSADGQMKASNLLNIAYFLSLVVSAVPEIFLCDDQSMSMPRMNNSNPVCFT